MVKRTKSYTAIMQELQLLLADMQSSELDVDAALTKYKRGQALISQLKKHLESAENEVRRHILPPDRKDG